jgi:hypothetical protein
MYDAQDLTYGFAAAVTSGLLAAISYYTYKHISKSTENDIDIIDANNGKEIKRAYGLMGVFATTTLSALSLVYAIKKINTGIYPHYDDQYLNIYKKLLSITTVFIKKIAVPRSKSTINVYSCETI